MALGGCRGTTLVIEGCDGYGGPQMVVNGLGWV